MVDRFGGDGPVDYGLVGLVFGTFLDLVRPTFIFEDETLI